MQPTAGASHATHSGRVHRCEIDMRPLDSAQQWVDSVREYWEARFDDLAAYLEELQSKERKQ